MAIEATGKTVEEAIERALQTLGCEREDVHVDVLENPSGGFLGLFGGHPAKIRVTKKAEAPQAEHDRTHVAGPVEKPKKDRAAAAPKEPEELKEARRMAEESDRPPVKKAAEPIDRPWMPPEESGAIETPYSEQRPYGVTATTPTNVKPFGDNTRRAEGARDGRPLRSRHTDRFERSDRSGRPERPSRRRPRRDRRDAEVSPYQEGRAEDREASGAFVEAADRPPVPSVPVPPEASDVPEAERTPRQRAERFLWDCFRCMGLDVTMTRAETDEGDLYDLRGDGLGLLIGKHGQTLDALQYLANLAANKDHDEERIRILLDVEGYRSRREETLRRLAVHLAEKACRIHAEVRLEPMNRHERKIIHMALQENRRVSTYSDGDEPYRCVVIAPKKRRRARPHRERTAEAGEGRTERIERTERVEEE